MAIITPNLLTMFLYQFARSLRDVLIKTMKNCILTHIKLAVASLLILVSCAPNQEKFDRARWSETDDLEYAYRSRMVQDLVANHLHENMKYSEIRAMLGESDFTSAEPGISLSYRISEEYEFLDVDPVSGKNLIVEFRADSTMSKAFIHEW